MFTSSLFFFFSLRIPQRIVDNVQLGLILGGECGLCPTESPTAGPTDDPSDSPTAGPVTPAPVTPAPVVTPAPALVTLPPFDTPVTPAPVTPAPVTPAPVTPAPVTPEPTPAPVTPAPVTPAPTPVKCVPEIPCTGDGGEGIQFCCEGLLDKPDVCVPFKFVEAAIEEGCDCGFCPTESPTASPTTSPVDPTPAPVTPAPTLAPTTGIITLPPFSPAPTPAPTTPAPVTPAPVTPAPTPAPTFECDPVVPCSDGEGIVFCVTNPEYEEFLGNQCILDPEDVQRAIEAEAGECGPCPPTEAPTMMDTPEPTPGETPEPTPGPGSECDSWVFKCGQGLFICGDVDPEELCNHGNAEVLPITDEQCEALIDALQEGQDGCDIDCPNGNAISNYGTYGCDDGDSKCNCDEEPGDCESCDTGFIQEYTDGCDDLEPCDGTDDLVHPSYTMCGRDGDDVVEFCANPDLVQFVLEEYPDSECGPCPDTPAPTPEPEDTPEPTPEPEEDTPEPTPGVGIDPVEDTPEPTPEPPDTPEPTPEPEETPEPTPGAGIGIEPFIVDPFDPFN